MSIVRISFSSINSMSSCVFARKDVFQDTSVSVSLHHSEEMVMQHAY